ncbi:MAG: PKD domain-containing protein [Candidatus Competibacteraceae bacterium]
MALARASLQWISGLVLLALVLSGWVLRTESAGSGGTVSADVSGQVTVKFSGLLFNRVMQTFDTVATVTNISSDTILAPLELHLASITPTTVTLHNPSGTASDGHPYIAMPLPTGELAPGATVTNVVLRFRNPSNVQFSFTHHVMGMVAARNTPPVADAGPDQSAQVGTTVTLDGSHSTDADGDALTYDWTLPSVPVGSTATLADPTTIHPRLTLDKPGSYTAQLVVNDGQAASAPDTVTVSTTNTPPVAKAGADQSAPVGATVTLDGSGSSDVDGNPLTFQWAVLIQPDGSTAALVNPTAMNPRLTLDRAGTYTACNCWSMMATRIAPGQRDDLDREFQAGGRSRTGANRFVACNRATKWRGFA